MIKECIGEVITKDYFFHELSMFFIIAGDLNARIGDGLT